MQISFSTKLKGAEVLEILERALGEALTREIYAEGSGPTFSLGIQDIESDSCLRMAFGEGGMVFIDPQADYSSLWILCEPESEFPIESFDENARIISEAFSSEG
jgi:hypothetical protein